jgi:hypothetical protein
VGDVAGRLGRPNVGRVTERVKKICATGFCLMTRDVSAAVSPISI